MKRTFIVFNDPGHAWAKVPLDVLPSVGLTAADFTTFSYLNRGHIFLEEDCDLGRFARAFEAQHGESPRFTERHCNNQSRIRSFWPNTEQARGYAEKGLI